MPVDKTVILLSELMNSMNLEGMAANHIVDNVDRSLKRAKMDPKLLDQAIKRLNEAPEFNLKKRNRNAR